MGFILFYLELKLRHFQTCSFLVTLIAETKHGVHHSDNTCPAGKNLKLFFADSNFIQMIDSPTRFSAFSHSCIDHIFTNMSSHIITDSGVFPATSASTTLLFLLISDLIQTLKINLTKEKFGISGMQILTNFARLFKIYLGMKFYRKT